MEEIRTKTLPRMRVATECYQMIHEADPESRISLTYIRRLAKSGMIPTVNAGNRILINYDALLSYLENPVPIPAVTGKIRPIPER